MLYSGKDGTTELFVEYSGTSIGSTATYSIIYL